jgi:hypothetical protein
MNEFQLKVVNIDGKQHCLSTLEVTRQFAYVVYCRLQLSQLKKTHKENLKTINVEFQTLVDNGTPNLIAAETKARRLEELNTE